MRNQLGKEMTNSTGFTMIELMIVLTVVGILSAFAYPSFIEQAASARRADAVAALQTMQINQASYRANNVTYSATLSDIWDSGTTSSEDYYDLAITANSVSSFTLTATPATGESQDGDRCGVFAMNESGKLKTGTYAGSPTKTNCW